MAVRPTAHGSFSSALKLSAMNDTNADNDARNVAFQITAGASSGGVAAVKTGGGGGSFEWLGLALLALIACARSPHQIRPRRIPHQPPAPLRAP